MTDVKRKAQGIRHRGWSGQILYSLRLATYALAVVLLCVNCSKQPTTQEKISLFEKVPKRELPKLTDDMDVESLRLAVGRSLIFYDRVPEGRTYAFGDEQVSVERLKESLAFFIELLDKNKFTPDTIAEAFDVYRVRPKEEEKGNVLITGYYEPILDGRLKPDKEYRYPLYGIPPDLITIQLSQFDPERFPKDRIIGRMEGKQLVPYYTRSEIDSRNKLKSSKCELAWLNDPVKAFFMHVQGSGTIKLPDGRLLRLGYAASNGRPYRSVGKRLIEKKVIASEAVSLQSIEAYLKEHPESIDEILGYNESYVFFRQVHEGPLGSIGVVLTPGRSIATDAEVYPRGGLGFLVTQKPVVDDKGEVIRWEPLNRWVLGQDAGGAIKGPGRVDLFAGSGEQAEWVAGRMKQPGTLYLFLKKKEAQS